MIRGNPEGRLDVRIRSGMTHSSPLVAAGAAHFELGGEQFEKTAQFIPSLKGGAFCLFQVNAGLRLVLIWYTMGTATAPRPTRFHIRLGVKSRKVPTANKICSTQVFGRRKKRWMTKTNVITAKTDVTMERRFWNRVPVRRIGV